MGKGVIFRHGWPNFHPTVTLKNSNQDSLPRPASVGPDSGPLAHETSGTRLGMTSANHPSLV